MLETSMLEDNLGILDPNQWFLVNIDTLSLHRTLYQVDLFELLKNDIDKLSPRDRLIIQNNAFAFVCLF
jgi:hypothetical protein